MTTWGKGTLLAVRVCGAEEEEGIYEMCIRLRLLRDALRRWVVKGLGWLFFIII